MAKKPQKKRDLFADLPEIDTGTPDIHKRLIAKMEQAVSLEQRKATLEAELRACNMALQDLTVKELPDLLDQMGIDRLSINDKDGGNGKWDAKVESRVIGSLPKDPDARQQAIDWLVKHEASSLIKTDVSVEFGRAMFKEANKLVARLRKAGYEPEVETGVHAQSLAAFARERLSNGEAIDLEVLGLQSFRQVKLKRTG